MRQRIKKLMSGIFKVPEADIPDEARYNVLKGWDSLGHITLMMAVESEFGVALTTQTMRNALTLLAIEDLVRKAQERKRP